MEVNGKNAVIAFGSIKTTVKLDRLERTNAQPKQADVSTKSTFISAQTQDSMYEKKLHFKQDIDVRGMRGDEALQAVTYFIDDAILVGMSRVRTFTEREQASCACLSVNIWKLFPECATLPTNIYSSAEQASPLWT